jgi:hypothetical protein
MLRWISIFGGLLIMMGHHARSEALFYYFRLEDQIPENHLLRLIDQHISFEFVLQQLKDSYSETGRPNAVFRVGVLQIRTPSFEGEELEESTSDRFRVRDGLVPRKGHLYAAFATGVGTTPNCRIMPKAS